MNNNEHIRFLGIYTFKYCLMFVYHVECILVSTALNNI